MEKVKYFLSIQTFGGEVRTATPIANCFSFSQNKQAIREWATEKKEYSVTSVEVFEITEREYYYQQAKYHLRLAKYFDDNKKMRLDLYHTAIRYTDRYKKMLNQ